jgi:hypothetical protein
MELEVPGESEYAKVLNPGSTDLHHAGHPDPGEELPPLIEEWESIVGQ